MCDRMGNYDITTETRELKMQWVRVHLLTHAGRGPKEELPPPFGRIKFTTGGTILGKEIYTKWNLANAVAERIKQETAHWGR